MNRKKSKEIKINDVWNKKLDRNVGEIIWSFAEKNENSSFFKKGVKNWKSLFFEIIMGWVFRESCSSRKFSIKVDVFVSSPPILAIIFPILIFFVDLLELENFPTLVPHSNEYYIMLRLQT